MPMTKYNFEGREIESSLDQSILDYVAGSAIAYKSFVNAKLVKPARERAEFINGVLSGLEVAHLIDSEERDKLLIFFIG